MRRKEPQSLQVTLGLGECVEGTSPPRALCRLPSRPPFPLRPSRARQQDPPKAKQLRGTSGPLRFDKTAILAPSSPGISGPLQRAALFCRKGKWKRMEERARWSQELPGGRAPRVGVWGGGKPQVALPDSRGLCGLHSASGTLSGARDPRLAYSPTPPTHRPASPR